MDNNKLDAIIKNGIKNASMKKDMELDVRRPVMERIEKYEMVKAKRPGIVTSLLYIYSLAAGLLCVIFFDKVAAYLKPFLQPFPTGSFIVEVALRGIFVFITACLLIIAIYYQRNPSTSN